MFCKALEPDCVLTTHCYLQGTVLPELDMSLPEMHTHSRYRGRLCADNCGDCMVCCAETLLREKVVEDRSRAGQEA